ncbi:family 1 extracellular solute-binding protein [Paenibacillus mucilaginosus 3016]|uniref:Family 1 extracellular solute-binding protein n=1 Tax=Paenibacillus mucilaginosus 3016 TaxID=1116391 RepID=H6NQS9_9BACL|nr:family 1 extracellular solute-binding protein [Paenibacillus mucilaginosus 3016]WFA16161.1 extracellular solute-binding protein [Paenibacillus mucilaginosus]
MQVKRIGKKVVASLIASLSMGLLLAACTDSDQKPKEAVDDPSKPPAKQDISVTIYDKGAVPKAEGTVESNRWTKWINEKGPANVKFVAVPRWESQEKLNVLFSSASAPDLIFEYAPHIKNPIYDQKQMMPIDELIEKHSTEYKKLLADNPALRKVGMKADGKLYEFARLSEVVPIHAILIREDWLQKLNLQAPKTTEELYQVAKAFAEKDPDGNGKKDTYGMAISFQSGYVVDQIFQATRWVVTDGKLVRNWENFRHMAEFKKRLFDEGIVDRDYLNDKNGAKAKQDFINGKIGIYPLQISWPSFTNGELAGLKKNVPDAKVAPIAYPKSPAGEFNPAFTNPVQATAFVNRAAKHPEAVMKYVDFLVKQDTAKTLKYGIENEHWKVGPTGCPVPIDPEKSKNEVNWTADYQMLSSGILDEKCGKTVSTFNSEVPIQKEGLELYQKALAIYLDLSKPYVELTHPEHMPQLPKDINVISDSMTKPIDDIWVKAVLGGKEYTPEQAMKDAQDTWNKGNGKKVEDWFLNWYEKDRDKAFLAKDIYDIMKKQHNLK